MIREIEPGEGHLVAAVLHELRTHLDPADIPALVDVQRSGGYRVVAAFADTPDAPDRAGGEAVAAAGFRTAINLSLGHHLYVDDLVTLPTARRGGPRPGPARLARGGGASPGLRAHPPRLGDPPASRPPPLPGRRLRHHRVPLRPGAVGPALTWRSRRGPSGPRGSRRRRRRPR